MAEQATTRTERAVKGTLASFLQYGTQMLLQLFLAPLVLRMAGQESLGAYALLMQVVAYLAMTDLGFSVTLNRYLAHANGYDDGGQRFRDVMSTARTFLLGSNVLFAILTLLLCLKVDVYFSLTPQIAGQARLGLGLLALWAVARTPWTLYSFGLTATQNLVAANFIGIIGNAARLIFSLGLVYSGAGLAGLILANVLAEAVSTIVSTFKFRQLFPLNRPSWGLPDNALFREMLGFSGHALLVNVAWRLVYNTDNIVVGALYGAAAVSVYYSTQMPTTIGFTILNRISENFAPAINELYARGDDAKVRETFLRLHRLNLLLVLLLAGGLLLLNGLLVALWVGPGQYAGDSMTAALAAFALLITVSHVGNVFVFASGNIRNYSRLVVLEGVCNLGLSIALGRYMGLAGVMWGTVITHIPTTVFLLIVLMRSLKISLPEFVRATVFPSVAPIMIAYPAALFAGRLLSDQGWYSFCAMAAILFIVYGSVAYMVSFTGAERIRIFEFLYKMLPLPHKKEVILKNIPL
jgi:O-antigen/teichoic acid export membrane protein